MLMEKNHTRRKIFSKTHTHTHVSVRRSVRVRVNGQTFFHLAGTKPVVLEEVDNGM